MIRIDEIYYNVFLPRVQDLPGVGLHWFDPFGSVDIKDMCNTPPIDGKAKLRILFWDQEPVYRETFSRFMEKFQKQYQGPCLVITSEKNSRDLQWAQDTYGIASDYYFFHGWAVLDWYRGYDHSFLSLPWMDRKFNHAFICPNNIVADRRSHRLRLLNEMYQRDCIRQNLISFPATCPYANKSVRELFEENNLSFPYDLDLPLIIDNVRNHANHSHRIDFWPEAMRSFCHVITETVYDDHRLHLTEKTFKPIVMQQPFLLVGSRGALAYLREYGFKTFGDLWDESYDDLDEEHRVGAVADICRDITAWSDHRRNQAQHQVAAVVKHNHDWFYSGFQDVLWDELCEMIEKWS
jgi:hypothetical protein